MFKLNFNNDVVSLGLGNLFRILLVIIYSRSMTYYLSFEELSSYYIVFSIYTFFSFIIIGSLGTYINRKTIDWIKKNSLRSAFNQIFIKFLAPLSILSIVSVFIYTFYSYGSINYSIIICLLVFLLIIIKTCNETVYPVFNIINKNTKYIFFLLLFNCLNLLFSVLFVNLFGYKFQYWMLGLILSNLFVLILSWRTLFQKSKEESTISLNFKELYSFTSNILLGNVLIWFLTDGFRFIAEKKFDPNSLGILLLGLMVSTQIFSIIESFLSQLMYPRYLKSISTDNFDVREKAFNSYLNIIIPTIFLSAIFVSLSTQEILSILIDKSKINSSIVFIFKVAVWIEFFRIILNALKHITTSEFKTQKLIFPYLMGCLIFIIGILFYDFTIRSLSILLLISYFLITILCFFLFNNILFIKLDVLRLIRLFVYLIPSYLVLYFFDQIIFTLFSSLYFAVIMYNFLNKDFSNEIN